MTCSWMKVQAIQKAKEGIMKPQTSANAYQVKSFLLSTSTSTSTAILKYRSRSTCMDNRLLSNHQ
jgi:hypothetical protein